MQPALDPAHPWAPLPRDLGDYVLLEEIGRGGMGIIFKARQCCLDRLCAVKMLRPGPMPAGPEAEARLRSEAAAAASLDHPNIVGIYEVGRAEGHLFFSMEFVPGEDLARYTRSRLLGARDIALILRRLAVAMAYAHGRGVLHHDLKPANVIMDPHGEPQITDFGLARRLGEAQRTDPGQGAGTPNFLAPEQASARFGEPGPRTDVFGLGAILYFLLTDRAPFVGVTCEDTLRAVLETEPLDPRALRRGTSADLATLCLKCLQKQPARRYGSVREIVEELDRFLADEPIRARPAGLLERGRRLCRRHPVIAGLSATIALLVSLLALGSSLAAVRIHEARRRALASEVLARRQLYNADLLLASTAFSQGHDDRVRRLLRGQVPTGGAPDLRGWEWRFLHYASQGDAEAVLGRHTSAVVQLATTRDGRSLVATDVGGNLAVWDLVSPPRQIALRSLTPVGAPRVALAPGSDRALAVQRGSGEIQDAALVLSLPGLEILSAVPLKGRHTAGSWSPDERSFWLLSQDAIVRHDTTTGRELERHGIARARRAFDCAFSRDGRWFATILANESVGIMDLMRGGSLTTLPGHPSNPVWGASCNSLRFSADDRFIVTAGSDGTVRLWSADPPRPMSILRGHADLVTSAAFSPEGSLVVSAGRDGFLMLTPLDIEGRPGTAFRLRGADPVQTCVILIPGTPAPVPISAGIDGVIHRWHPTPRDRMPTLAPLPPGAAEVTPLGDGRHFVARVGDAALRVGGLADGKLLYSYDPVPGTVSAAVEWPEGGDLILAQLTSDGRVSIDRVGSVGKDRKPPSERTLEQPPTSARTANLVLSPDARRLAVADMARGVQILAIPTLETIRTLEGRPQRLQFSASGRWIAAGSVGGTVQVADLSRPGSDPVRFEHPQHSGFAFSPGEDRLASVGYDGTILLHELGTGREVARVDSGLSHFVSVLWSRDQRRLFVATLGGAVSAWDLSTLRETFILQVHPQPITGLREAEDGALITFAPDSIRTLPAP